MTKIIQKKFQGTVPENKILDTYSNSQTDTYSCSYINDLDNKLNYSTEEQVVGKWVDGKPIYRKVIECGALPNNSTKNIATGLISSNIRVIRIFGAAQNTTSGAAFDIPAYFPGGTGNVGVILLSNNNIAITTDSDRSAYNNTNLIIEYTKTTD